MIKSELYRQDTLDHGRNPRNFGKLSNADAFSREANLSCGDEIILYVKFGKNNAGKSIADISFEGRGCLVCVAAGSKLTEYIKGKRAQDAAKMTSKKALALFGAPLTPSREPCALLSYKAMRGIFDRSWPSKARPPKNQ